jgi:hypothetical protein
MGLRDHDMALYENSGTVWKVRPKRVKAPYAKFKCSLVVSQVERDT